MVKLAAIMAASAISVAYAAAPASAMEAPLVPQWSAQDAQGEIGQVFADRVQQGRENKRRKAQGKKSHS